MPADSPESCPLSPLTQCACNELVLQAWAQLEWSDGRWMIAVKLLESALQANRNHLPSWMVSNIGCTTYLPHICWCLNQIEPGPFLDLATDTS